MTGGPYLRLGMECRINWTTGRAIRKNSVLARPEAVHTLKKKHALHQSTVYLHNILCLYMCLGHRHTWCAVSAALNFNAECCLCFGTDTDNLEEKVRWHVCMYVCTYVRTHARKYLCTCTCTHLDIAALPSLCFLICGDKLRMCRNCCVRSSHQIVQILFDDGFPFVHCQWVGARAW